MLRLNLVSAVHTLDLSETPLLSAMEVLFEDLRVIFEEVFAHRLALYACEAVVFRFEVGPSVAGLLIQSSIGPRTGPRSSPFEVRRHDDERGENLLGYLWAVSTFEVSDVGSWGVRAVVEHQDNKVGNAPLPPPRTNVWDRLGDE